MGLLFYLWLKVVKAFECNEMERKMIFMINAKEQILDYLNHFVSTVDGLSLLCDVNPMGDPELLRLKFTFEPTGGTRDCTINLYNLDLHRDICDYLDNITDDIMDNLVNVKPTITLAEKIKLAGQELIDRAEGLVPVDSEHITSFNISITFEPGYATDITTTASTICKNEFKV